MEALLLPSQVTNKMFTWSFGMLAGEHHLHDLSEEDLKLNLLVLKAPAAVEDVVKHKNSQGATVSGDRGEEMRHSAEQVLSFGVAGDLDLNISIYIYVAIYDI